MGRDALREYVRGSLWVLPSLSVLAALAAGAVLSSISIGPRSPLAFQGTPDDARTLLLGITGTMITVIALLLGLAVVALQLSSTQFSPRLLRNFLRDRPNQVVLSAFVATFAYSAAGLYTVGVSGGNRTTAFPRLAVSGAIVLLLASLGLLVFFADHLLHSIQVDAIMETVQRNTLAVIEDGLLAGGQEAPEAPAWAVPIASTRSGYVQAVRPGTLLPPAARHGLTLRLRLRAGEHVVAGTTLAWIWPASPGDPAPDPRAFARALDSGVRIGFERTLEQDAAFGIRQLVDVACKALSPAVNDPYTAVQAVDHLSVIFCALARRPLGAHVVRDGDGVVIVPARRFGDYLSVMCGLIRRYGASEPTVAHALLRLLGNCAAVAGDDPEHCAAIEEQARIIVSDAEREVTQPADLDFVHAEAGSVLRAVTRNSGLPPVHRPNRASRTASASAGSRNDVRDCTKASSLLLGSCCTVPSRKMVTTSQATENQMKFMLQVRFNGADKAIGELSAGDQEKVTAEFEEIRRSSGVLDGNQLQAASTAATVRVDGRQPRVSEGPAVAAGSELDGYYLYDAADLDAAIAFAQRIPATRFGATVEVRPILER